ncbi:hypothetical protein ACW9HQ_49400, partial [Nocardia gipuzkoensis]
MSIIIEPRQAVDTTDPEGGVFPTSSRNSLSYIQPSTSKAVGRDLPWGAWEQTFIDNMPQFVVEAIEAATPEDFTDIDQDIVERVAQPYMDMFRQIVWVRKEGGAEPGTANNDSPVGFRRRRRRDPRPDPGPGPHPGPFPPDDNRDGQEVLPTGTEGGEEVGESRQVSAEI